VNNVKTETEQQVKRPEPPVLLDCGQATKVTKGIPFLIFWEYCAPPADTTFL